MNKLLLLNLLLSSLVFANESIYTSYDKALEVAKKEHKIVMIKLTAEHCQYCKKMDKKVMIEKEVISLLKKKFLSVEIDVNNDIIPLDLNQTMTPTFIFVTEDETIITKVPGSWEKEDFLDILNSVIKKSKKEKGEAS